jgi:FAD/FMN-containing dehydrogenase
LVFGSSPLHDEIVLSLENMNATLEIHRNTMSATADAGIVLETLQNAAKAHELLVPLDMGSKGSCTIGGNVSTSAGGIHFARYGSMRSNVLGLQVVTAQGEVLDLMSSLRKDNVGYDLKQLYIGSEGTLGVVTQVEMKLFPYPRSSNLAVLLVRDFATLLKVFHLANATLAESLSAFEVMDAISIAHGSFPFPATRGTEYGVFVETHGSSEDHNLEKLAAFVTACEDNGVPLLEQVIATNPTQTKTLWKIREDLPVKLAQSGKMYKFDLSFALDGFELSVIEAKRLLYEVHRLPPAEVIAVGYGHFGDGNVHLNVIDLARKHDAVIQAALYPCIYEFAAKMKGSVSAEHGVGWMKREYLPLSRSPVALRLMRDMKHLLDPNGILNPYKVVK